MKNGDQCRRWDCSVWIGYGPQPAFIIASDRFNASAIAFINTRKIISVRLSENPVFGKL